MQRAYRRGSTVRSLRAGSASECHGSKRNFSFSGNVTSLPQPGRRNKRIFDLWLACYSGKEIAEAVDLSGGRCPRPSIIISKRRLCQMEIKLPLPTLLTFSPPLYNVWKQLENDMEQCAAIGLTFRLLFQTRR